MDFVSWIETSISNCHCRDTQTVVLTINYKLYSGSKCCRKMVSLLLLFWCDLFGNLFSVLFSNACKSWLCLLFSSSLKCLVFETLNPQPLGCKFFALTNRPLLPPFFGELSRYLKKLSLITNSSKFYNSKFNLFIRLV